jgi:hypothetical protein
MIRRSPETQLSVDALVSTSNAIDHHHDVLTRFHHFAEVADRTRARRTRQRAVLPDRLPLPNQPAAGEIARRQVVVAGEGDERSIESPRHVLHESSPAASGRPLEHDAKPAFVALLEHGDLVSDGKIERLLPSRRPETVGQVARRACCLLSTHRISVAARGSGGNARELSTLQTSEWGQSHTQE